MRNSWVLCLLLGTLAWGQAPASAPPAAQPAPPPEGQQMKGGNLPPIAPKPAAPADTSAQVPPTAAVITIDGVCATPPKTAVAKGAAAKPATGTKPVASKTPSADCKTVITKADFEKLASALSPNVTPQMKRQLANILPQTIAMSDEAKKEGLDKKEPYLETLKFAKMQILRQQLQRKIQEDAAKIPPSAIDAYYKQNPEAYEQYNLERLFVPRTKQVEPESKEEQEKDAKLTDEEKKKKEEDEKVKAEAGEMEMSKLADTLRERAAKGEDFITLQKDAFAAAGMKIESPTVSLPKVRRTGLPPAHAAVFDLKVGEVSQVISDNGGHYIYKVIGKEVLPLDQVTDEIHNKLQSERSKEAMDKVQNSFKSVLNDAYFGPMPPGGVQGPPPRRIPNPRVPPVQVPPQAAQPTTPPQAAPAPSGDAKPN